MFSVAERMALPDFKYATLAKRPFNPICVWMAKCFSLHMVLLARTQTETIEFSVKGPDRW